MDAADGGNEVWKEERAQVGIEGGMLQVELGGETAFGQTTFYGPRWLAIDLVNGPGKLAPRTPLTSVPYALKAGDATTLAGKTVGTFATQAGLTAAIAAVYAKADMYNKTECDGRFAPKVVTYIRTASDSRLAGGTTFKLVAKCDPGDLVQSGGCQVKTPEGSPFNMNLATFGPTGADEYTCEFVMSMYGSFSLTMTTSALCSKVTQG